MPFLKTPAAARHFGVCRSTFRGWADKPGFPPPKRVGPKIVLFDVEAVARWLDKHPARNGDPVTGPPSFNMKRAARGHAHA